MSLYQPDSLRARLRRASLREAQARRAIWAALYADRRARAAVTRLMPAQRRPS